MKKLFLILPIIMIIGCAPNAVVDTPEQPTEVNIEEIKEQLKEEIKEEVKEEIKQEEAEKEPELTLETYDYKTDPDTIIVKINEDNLSDYVSLEVYEHTYIDEEEPKTLYSVQTHSRMYDDGYVCVGYEDTYIEFGKGVFYDEYLGELMFPSGIATSSGCPFSVEVCWKINSKETADKYATEPILYFEPRFRSKDATLYFQKLEDVKFGYEIVDGIRTVNGEKSFCFKENPY